MTRYAYRRKLSRRELGPALGAGAGVGLAIGAVVAYLTQIFLRRETIGASATDRVPRSPDSPDGDSGS